MSIPRNDSPIEGIITEAYLSYTSETEEILALRKTSVISDIIEGTAVATCTCCIMSCAYSIDGLISLIARSIALIPDICNGFRISS